ncbi:YciK family oxidoreductase [Alteromonas lipolytica]|uniref:YciK family oxidoreductase n=1 Tax=Alteromonas lipolytica TaxID=1856405 RepID=A0A1E8FHY6_9ALTE|nr:YciK family oxidoreductase [Alteromonas lipolytica]OFI35093.1 YciK family oxidoreductase [Alteromonas lipolytica]GGF56588.1 YciK family oxidoreductase [Alteromonas lipolytica]
MNDYIAPDNLLNGKTILITGAGDGIGKQAAITYASHGATCILLGKTVSKLEAVYDEIVAAGAPEPAIVPLDLNGATPKHYQDMANTIGDQFGQLDGILFNAGKLGHLSPFVQIPVDEWQQVMQVNVNSSVYMLQPLLPLLLKSAAASVIFTSSSVGRKGRAFWGTYSVSKFATEGLMQVLADEYKNKPLRFNCINPGATRTAMRAKAFPAENAETLKTPADIMPLYLYLMGEDSKDVNGESFDCQPK